MIALWLATFIAIIIVPMYLFGGWKYHTDAMYRAEFGRPFMWPWRAKNG